MLNNLNRLGLSFGYLVNAQQWQLITKPHLKVRGNELFDDTKVDRKKQASLGDVLAVMPPHLFALFDNRNKHGALFVVYPVNTLQNASSLQNHF